MRKRASSSGTTSSRATARATPCSAGRRTRARWPRWRRQPRRLLRAPQRPPADRRGPRRSALAGLALGAVADPLDVVGVEHRRRAGRALRLERLLALIAPALALLERAALRVVHGEIAVVVRHNQRNDHDRLLRPGGCAQSVA